MSLPFSRHTKLPLTPRMRHVIRCVPRRLVLLLLVGPGVLSAADLIIPVYGVIAATDMDPGVAAWFASGNPSVFRQLVIGQITYTTSQSVSPFTLAMYHGHLIPQIQSTPTGYAITGYLCDRLESVSLISGSLQTTVLLSLSPPLPVAANATSLMVYAIQGATVDAATLSNGFLFPTASDGSTFRWTESGVRMRGATDGTWLIGGSAEIIPLPQSVATPLSSYPGAYVQLKDSVTGQYRYILQSQITTTTPASYDPVLANGGLIVGGSSTVTSGPTGTATATYTLDGVVTSGTFLLANTLITLQLPSALQAAALASEVAPTVTTTLPTIVTSQNRGTIPDVDSHGVPTGRTVPLYSNPTASQSTVQVLSDIDVQRANAVSAAPVDTLANSSSPDRITAPVTGSGASGLNQLDAQHQAASWDYLGATVASGTDATTTITHGTNADGTPNTESISAATVLAQQDQQLNDQVTITYGSSGSANPPQATPLVVNATGTISQARVAGDPDEVYSRVDMVNVLMAPHMENTVWPGGYTPRHHQAMIYPIDYEDQWMVSKYGAATGVTIPDKLGDPIPGDGLNPYTPVPQGCQAGHPFYDLDGDGSLDRWYSDDPFDGGYKKLKIMWYEEPGGSRELGSFSSQPSYNVCVVGIHKPTLSDAGVWTTSEDLLFSVGHNFKPFDHASFHLTGYKTYYDGGLITPLDPIDAGDPTLYQLSLRNLTTFAPPATPPADGATPQQMTATVVSGMQPVQMDLLGTGQPQSYSLYYTIDYYDQLATAIQTPPWSWAWSDNSFSLPNGVVDHVGSPAIVFSTYKDATGATVRSTRVSRPLYTDPTTSQVTPFDPSLIPVSNAPPPAQTPVADTYMWNYPVGVSTAEGGTVQADPIHWQFPWNLPWNNDPHSRNMSSQGFQLNSANMSYFPAYAQATPRITHQGLVADGDGVTPLVIQWLLRENPQPNPSGVLADWVNGQVLYTQLGWAPPTPWINAGRSLFHVAGWDARSDAWSAGRSIGGCTIPAGTRIFDVVAGYSTYLFRGHQYVCKTTAEQIALLQRMWNYYLTGYEYPPPQVTTLPSLCIPQRLNNGDITSPLLNTVQVPLQAAPDVTVDKTNANLGGDLTGGLVADLASPASPRYREQTQRRIHLMNQQIYLFSASRGREWELQMARRMPQSVRLVCVEYDDKEAVKAVLGVNGGNVYFPQVSSSTYTDSMGATHTVETSNERDVLKEVAEQWLDGLAPVVCYENGQVGINGDYSIHTATPSNTQSVRTGSGSTIDPSVFAAYNGFARMLPEGLPEGFALYAFPLRCLPLSPQQWAPDAGQPIYANVAIEFRHPMLILYHDVASSIYIHYGRNADPDAVFGHWNDCAPPPANLNITSDEFQRRQRFDIYATTPVLTHIYDLLHADGYANWQAAQATLPPAPPDPGPQPTAPTVVAYPGPEPQAPIAPWAGLPGYDGLTLQQQAAQYIGVCPGHIPPLTWSVSWWDDQTRQMTTPIPIGAMGQDASHVMNFSDSSPGIGRWATGAYVFTTSFTWIGPGLTLQGTDYFDNQAVYDLNGSLVDQRDWTAGSGSIPATFQDGQTYDLMIDFQGYGTPNAIDLAYPNPDYDSWPLRQQQVDAYTTALTAFQGADPIWQQNEQAYLQYLAAEDAFQSQYAVWSSQASAWNQWMLDNQALIQAKAAAQSYVSDRQAWVSLVLTQTGGANASYAGDPSCLLTTLAQFQTIQPPLPIWEAYAWFVDPTNGVTQALPILPGP